MANLTDSQIIDYQKYYIEGGEPGFSPERNKAIIEGTITKYEAIRRQKQKEYIEQVRERADAVAMYFKSKAVDSNRPIESYLGRRELARLQGQRIVQKIKRLASGKQVITFEEL